MSKYLIEILEEANADPKTLEKHKDNQALRMLFEHAFLPEKKFELPEGAPPFKPDAAPLGMTPTNFTQEMRRLYIFTPARPLPKIRKEALFVQLLETIHPSEAKLLIAIKDQTLNKLYKNITSKVAAQYGFIPEQEKDKVGGRTPKKPQVHSVAGE